MYASSIVFDARSFGAQLPRHLAALHRVMRYGEGKHELLVVDDTGDRRLPGLACRFGVTLVSCRSHPLGERLNIAVAASQGELLLFPGLALDGFHRWLASQFAGLGRQEWDAVVLRARRESVLLRLLSRLHRTSPTDTFCVTHRWFERIGGFDPALEQSALPELIERLQACQARVSIESA
ncbi:hypothetical protein DU490_12380 [Halomonas sp. DQ26W]|uniref:hypothetical protein n=1 Tax=Halomonas sp. DQ26W TaxID=2282311 RepID=UPI000DF7CA54|nr:hypothetical protein [Halomonas sp. DQ26W]RDB42546.1 hypothetical protein DU490_12380 [Halomonas sp. DQ26W]